MKKVLLFMSLSISVMVKAQNISIPDVNFKNALLNAPCVDTDGNNIGDADADTNNDGNIQLSEAQAVSFLAVDSLQIASLSGIENFVNLTHLSCCNNQLTSLDVHTCTQLRTLRCFFNQLTSLDLQACTQLRELVCFFNQLTSLDPQTLPNLETLLCGSNPLTSLDVHGLAHLLLFNCSFCQLTNLNLANLPLLDSLVCSFNQLTTLVAEDSPGLMNLYCDGNPLTSLYIKNGTTVIGEIDITLCPDLVYICCDAHELSYLQDFVTFTGLVNCTVTTDCGLASNNEPATSHELNVFPNPTDGLLNIATDLNINRLDIYDINGRLIQSQQISANQVDVKFLEGGVYFLRLHGTDGVYYSKFVKQ